MTITVREKPIPIFSEFNFENKKLPLKTKFLKIVKTKRKFLINKVDGKKLITNSSRVKFEIIDKDFKETRQYRDKDYIVSPTNKTEVKVYNLIKEASFKEMFKSLNLSKEKLSLSEAQIMDFVGRFPGLMKNETLLFLSKNKETGKFFVFCVGCRKNNKIQLDIMNFYYDYDWHTLCRLKIVVPEFSLI